MLRYILPNIFLIGLQAVCKNYFHSITTPIRWKKHFMVSYTLSILSLWTVNNIAFPEGAAILDILIITLCIVVPPLFAEKGYRLKAIITATIFTAIEIIVMYAVGLVAFPIAEHLGYPSQALVDKTTSYGNAIMALICTPVILVSDYLAATLLRKLFANRHLTFWTLCFLPIPISQGIIVNLLCRMIPYSGGIRGLNAAFTVALLASVAADIGFSLGVSRVQRAEHLKEQIRIAEEQLSIQTSYYRQLQDNILSINQIRHDLNNQLQAAYHLLEQGEHSQVRSQLDQIQANVRDRVGPKFCANLMVDAVLTEKSRLCQEQNIRFDVNANLPRELPIESAHLCSAFSNLLDNSIQGAEKSASPEPWIELRTALHSDYLIIRCLNSSGSPSSRKAAKDPMRTHGLGLDILKQIAALYHGSFETEQQDVQFEAALILRFPDKTPTN